MIMSLNLYVKQGGPLFQGHPAIEDNSKFRSQNISEL